MKQKFYSKDGKIRPITPRTPHVSYKAGGQYSFDDIDLAKKDAALTKIAFEQKVYMGSRDTAIAIKRSLVQAANRARVMSRDPDRYGEEKQRLMRIADIYENTHREMIVPIKTFDKGKIENHAFDAIVPANVSGESAIEKQAEIDNKMVDAAIENLRNGKSLTERDAILKAVKDQTKSLHSAMEVINRYDAKFVTKTDSKWFKEPKTADEMHRTYELQGEFVKFPHAIRTKEINGVRYNQIYHKNVAPDELD